MNIDTSNLIFEPMVELSTMIVFSVIMLVIILLNRKHIINRVLILALLIVISQRPMFKEFKDDVFKWDFDIIFVIDNTVSMNAIDVNGKTRFDAAKKDIEKLIEDFAGSNFAIINYSNIAQLKYPFTKSSEKILNIVNKLKTIDPNYAKGSSLDLPYEYMKMLLESSRTKDEHKTIVFFMGDGELSSSETINSDLNKYKELKELVDSGAVLGYGTTEGSKIKITESVNLEKIVDSEGFLINASTNSPYISKLDENNLKTIADNLGISYYHMTDYSVLENKIRDFKLEAVKDEEEKMEKKVDIYYYFSGILVVLLLFELLYYRRNA